MAFASPSLRTHFPAWKFSVRLENTRSVFRPKGIPVAQPWALPQGHSWLLKTPEGQESGDLSSRLKSSTPSPRAGGPSERAGDGVPS